jgi:cytochrome P450
MANCPEFLGSLTSSEARARPIQFLRRLQAEAPVYRDPITGFYIVTRKADLSYVAANPKIFSNENEILMGRGDSPVAAEVHRRFQEHGFPELHTLATADPPVHTKYRRLVDKAFTPKIVASLEPKINEIVDELIDSFVSEGKVELAWQFAHMLSLYVIIDQLGFDRKDWRRIR